jgi:Ca2+/H+ antiporter, TMEM165/GDT1 family
MPIEPYLVLATFGTVFLTEMVGDKALFTISAMAARLRPWPVFCGIALAFMAKMLAAVLLGNAISELPAGLIAAASGITFMVTAIVIWFKKPENAAPEPRASKVWWKALLIAFSAIFFSEWADAGQLTTAILTARYQAPLIIWIGATLAMVAKGILALTVGVGLRRYVPHNVLRYGAASICLAMSILSAFRIEP